MARLSSSLVFATFLSVSALVLLPSEARGSLLHGDEINMWLVGGSICGAVGFYNDTGEVANSVTMNGYGNNSCGESQAWATAAPGILTGWAWIKTQNGGSEVSISFFDTLTASAPADLEFTLTLHATPTIGDTGHPPSDTCGFASAGLSGSFGVSLRVDGCSASQIVQESYTTHVDAGSFEVFYDLVLGVGRSPWALWGSSEIDAGDTAAISIDVLTPGVTLTSDSGHTYSSVPEPAGVFLLATGLAGVAALPRKSGFEMT